MHHRFWVIAILALFVASSLFVLPSAQDSEEAPLKRVASSALVSHSPIAIDGDSGFLGANSSTGISKGSGTIDDPYVITGWRIDAIGAAAAISVRNSDAFFIVRDCTLSNASWAGIEIVNVSNGTLEGNDCSGNQCGISVRSSRNNSLSNNICADNPSYGILLVSSQNITVSFNTCTGSESGIDLHESDGNQLVNNTCSGNTIYGIALKYSNGNMLLNSTCFYDQYGIDLHSSDNNTLLNNSCSHDQYGIWIGFSFDNRASNNTCSIDQYGIALLSSCNNTISENICLSNALTGISMDSSDNNTLSKNICTGNRYGIDMIRLMNKVENETDFYFYRIGPTYYVKENSTGLVIRSGTNARSVIQDTIDSLGAEPVRFFFDSSEYIIDSSGEHEWLYYPALIWEIGIEIDKQITMMCNGTTFKAANGLANPLFVFYVYYVDYVEFRGAHIDCNQNGQATDKWVTGIGTRRADWLLIENCDIEDFGGYGIFIDSNSSFPTIRYNYVHDSANDDYAHGISCHNNGEEGLVFGNRVERIGNAKYGIFIDSINNVRVIGNYIADSDGPGIVVSDKSRETLVMGNWIVTKTAFPSILVASSNDTQVIGNYIFGNMSYGIYRGPIKVDAFTHGTVVKNNYMSEAGIMNSGEDTQIFDNYGYLIEEAPIKYFVDFDGGNYRAENATGVLKFSNSNFSALMTSVIASVSNGSKIIFREGTYLVEKSGLGFGGRYYGIIVDKTLQFEGEGATFLMADGTDCNYSIILVDGVFDFRARGIAFDVNSDGQGMHTPSWSSCGIQIVGSVRPLIQKCDFYDFNYMAIDIDGSPGAQTALDCLKDDDKTFPRNTIYAITLSWSCDHNIILRNNCSDCTSYGLNIAEVNSTGNSICNNTFFRNNCSEETYSKSHAQAYDGGIGNLWNTSGLPLDLNFGNYWSDWKTPDEVPPYTRVDSPYELSGAGLTKDFYPLTQPVAPTLNLIPPIEIPDFVGTLGLNGWYVTAIQIPFVSVVNLTDYGIFHMYYSLDQGLLMDYDIPMTVMINGEHTLDFYVLDIAGNIIHVRSFSFKLDTQPPYPEVTLTGTLSPSIWYTSNVTFDLRVHDYVSGVNSTCYRIDGAAWYEEDWSQKEFTFALADGVHVVEYYSTDNASNTGQTKSLTILIDTVAPTIDVASVTGTIKDSNVTVYWNSTDNNSGIAKYDIIVDGVQRMTVYNGTSSAVISFPNGAHTVVVKATDVAGNSAEDIIYITVDADYPELPNPDGEISVLLLIVIVAGSIMLLLMLRRGSHRQQK